MKSYLSFILLSLSYFAYSQTKISGIVKDEYGYEISYATVMFADNSAFTNADAEGNYTLSCNECTSDSILIKSLGYKTTTASYIKNKTQTIDFILKEDVIELEAVVLGKSENPAFAIMRKVIDNKPNNDIRSLEAYQYESYNKVELDANNITEGFIQEKVLKKLNTSIKELNKLVDDKGRQFFPVFISETISDYYFNAKPEAKRENVKATRVTGVGMTDGSFTAQLIGATYTQFNFYENSMSFLEKEFISPIATGWKLYYDYELIDSMLINNRFSYQLDIKPKNPNAAAFEGTIWIDKATYALNKIDLIIPKSANINFIKTIEIAREWIPTEAGPFFPRRTSLVIDAENITKKSVGVMVKSTFTIDSLIINKPKDNAFFKYPLHIDDNSQSYDQSYWEENRHDSLSQHELDAFALVDTIKNLPVLNSYIDILNTITNGHLKVGKISFGSYLKSYAYNDVEKHRIRIGAKTNIDFSKKVFLSGYLAYGAEDEKFKHELKGRYILSKFPYTETGFKWQNDLQQLGLDQTVVNEAFNALTRWGKLVSPYYGNTKEVFFSNQLNRHFSTKLILRHKSFDPLFDIDYYKNNNEVASTINTSEIEINTRFAFNEDFLQTDNGRKSLGSLKPKLTLGLIMGIKGVLDSDFDYQKITLGLEHKIGLGVFGLSKINVKTGTSIGTLPYPLLNVHLGNQTNIFISNGFNMMNYSEFVTEQFIDLKWEQHFQGLLFDRIPLFKKLKLREVVNVAALWGNVSQKNFDILTPQSRIFGTFDNYPYVEVGYGIENILKIIRIQVFQRITYLERPNTNRFGLRIGFQFML